MAPVTSCNLFWNPDETESRGEERREQRGTECNNTIGGEGGGAERIETEQIKKKEAMKEKRKREREREREGGKNGGVAYVLSHGLQW